MNSRIVLATGIVFAMVHLAISIGCVLLAAVTSDMPEWGMLIAAYLTTFPLADLYDGITSGQPTAVAVTVPILFGALVYWAIGTSVAMAVELLRNRG
jgi:hypothetical protein